MQVIYKRCAAGDVHKKTIVVCVLISHEDGRVEKFIRTFRTMTADLLALDDPRDAQRVYNKQAMQHETPVQAISVASRAKQAIG